MVGIIELVSELAVRHFFFPSLWKHLCRGSLDCHRRFLCSIHSSRTFHAFELFGSLVQGIIFGLLTLFFVKLAVTPVASIKCYTCGGFYYSFIGNKIWILICKNDSMALAAGLGVIGRASASASSEARHGGDW